MWEKIDSLALGASYHLERSKVIEGNIANGDTPGYRPKELLFSRKLEEESLALRREDPRHIDPSFPREPFREVELDTLRGYDDNRVDIEEELAKLAESSIMYKALGENLKKEFSKLKLVITGR
ncbi:MAG: flagellar basal body rod protein FlgB [Epsilonproteobacteria bacterium]|nr:flagellar basal body rod protein FlgB [Campylobacterota bacterium]NPA56900.1 flagellar basal body rod protein FlgB [Campylobacterota bacterium]